MVKPRVSAFERYYTLDRKSATAFLSSFEGHDLKYYRLRLTGIYWRER